MWACTVYAMINIKMIVESNATSGSRYRVQLFSILFFFVFLFYYLYFSSIKGPLKVRTHARLKRIMSAQAYFVLNDVTESNAITYNVNIYMYIIVYISKACASDGRCFNFQHEHFFIVPLPSDSPTLNCENEGRLNRDLCVRTNFGGKFKFCISF